jgi:tRNA(Arg) A34 adenosine deaminase TadA
MPALNIVNFAIKTAKQSKEDFRLAAVLFKGGAILRGAANSGKSIGYRRGIFPFEPTRHSEIAVIHNVPRDILKKCGVLIVRVDKNNQLTSARPCRACMLAFQQANMSKVYYSNYQGKIDKINPLGINVDNWEKEKSAVEI